MNIFEFNYYANRKLQFSHVDVHFSSLDAKSNPNVLHPTVATGNGENDDVNDNEQSAGAHYEALRWKSLLD